MQVLRGLLANGEKPACVDACVMRALGFGELSELRAKYGNVNAIEPLPEAKLTVPALGNHTTHECASEWQGNWKNPESAEEV